MLHVLFEIQIIHNLFDLEQQDAHPVALLHPCRDDNEWMFDLRLLEWQMCTAACEEQDWQTFMACAGIECLVCPWFYNHERVD